MNIGIKHCVLAIVTTNKSINCTTTPIFYVENKEELQGKALALSKCMMGMVHDVGDETLIIVKH
ncbi:hypothetical protein SAMN05661008_01244 [Alkalithermobacter thermoalcaliphilus JW-YL-7 = DSM 7308]|uniref:Uncharacterized protein n=1 Tax=Alkalithermobacter thermoalcaliphilus JW-YL-7 = DSM 7308 TaxID=1121328 RepID=A0A150FPS0_CLOPD|nr:hypothetical protein JWYL7_0641 [[Clostridium] paradoxum JW-YL-7 = DSM 7308]SHK97763.1 hypothetical protein SAMN05661008_01244 [[Clostridium] paradoxum JW-YL-7 = DSM 7308]